MFSFSEVKRYITDSPAVMRFKPWWEIGLDLLLAGLFLLMLLSWTRTFPVESGGLICVPLEGDITSYATGDARYVTSRCYVESSVKTVEFYPYILFLQWIVMFLCQITWIWIPAVVAKFIFFHNIFTEILNVDPSFFFNPNSLGMLPEIEYNDENREKLKVLHDKITFMLMDENYLSKVYRRKVCILTVFIACCILWVFSWLFFVRFLQSNFSCKLLDGKAEKGSVPQVCSIAPYMFVYGIMLLHIFILSLMLFLSAKGAFWHSSLIKRVQKRSDRFSEGHDDNYKGLPGFEDLTMILELLKTNVRDGKLMLSVITYVLTAKYNSRQPITTAFSGQGGAIMYGGYEDYRNKFTFSEEWKAIDLILKELGFKICDYKQSPNCLYRILEKLRKNRFGINFNVDTNIKEMIANEIHKNIFRLSSLAESPTSCPPKFNSTTVDDDDGIPRPRYSVVRKLETMKDDNDWPDHLILHAAANVLCVQFIIISVNSPAPHDFFSTDVIAPLDNTGSYPNVILVFINPFYYYLVKRDPASPPEQLLKQSDYVTSQRYRERLRVGAIRKIATTKLQTEKSVALKKPFHTKKHRTTGYVMKTQADCEAVPTVATNTQQAGPNVNYEPLGSQKNVFTNATISNKERNQSCTQDLSLHHYDLPYSHNPLQQPGGGNSSSVLRGSVAPEEDASFDYNEEYDATEQPHPPSVLKYGSKNSSSFIP